MTDNYKSGDNGLLWVGIGVAVAASATAISLYMNKTPPADVTSEFSGSPTTGDIPLHVQFTDASTGSPTGHTWNFGDGNVSNETNPSHTYSTAGTYSVTLTVSNATSTNTVTKTGYIIASAPYIPPTPVLDFVGIPTSGNAPLTVQFTDTSSGITPTAPYWEFGDGGYSYENNPIYTYINPGTFGVVHEVTQEDHRRTLHKPGYITVIEPVIPLVASFTATPVPDHPMEFQFTDTSTGPIPRFYFWTFGDGGSSRENNPIHVYQFNSTFHASMSVSVSGGSQLETAYADVNVTSPPPTRPIHITVINTYGYIRPAPGASVYISGEYVGVTDSVGMLTINLECSEKQVTLTASLGGNTSAKSIPAGCSEIWIRTDVYASSGGHI